MSGSRWVIKPLWLSRSWRYFLYSSSVYSCHLFLISSASVRSLPFLSFIELISAWNVPLASLIFLKRSLGKHRQHIKKQRRYFANKGSFIQRYGFSRVMYGWESWIIKSEPQIIDAFELWWWRRLLRICWTARRSNQSILKEINPKYSLEGLMLKLKLQCFGHLMQRDNSLEKILMLRKTEGKRRWWQRMI